MTISATCTWRAAGFVEGGADDFALDGALHVGDFLRALVDEQDDEHDLRMVGGNGVGDGLQAAWFCRCGAGRRMRPRWPLPTGVNRSMTGR